MYDELITIVIPVYNTEDYLEKCLKSAVEQTYKNLEIIIVDDGSKDASYEIAKGYANVDSRIILLKNEKNKGLSCTRNRAIEIAKGKYVCFIDSDDYVDNRYIEVLYEGIKLSGGGLLSFCSRRPVDREIEYINIDAKTLLVEWLDSNKYSIESACAKLINRELLSDIKFKENIINEDTYWLGDIFKKILQRANAKITYCNYYGYHVFERSGSLTRSGFGIKNYDKCIACEHVYDLFKDTEYKKYAYNKYLGSLLYYVLKGNALKLNNVDEAIKKLNELLSDNNIWTSKPKFIPLILMNKLKMIKLLKLK